MISPAVMVRPSPDEHGRSLREVRGEGRADQHERDHQRAPDERGRHVVSRIAGLLRELVHRCADEREGKARDRRAQQGDAVVLAHCAERDRLRDRVRQQQQRECGRDRDEPGPRDAAVVRLAEQVEAVLQRFPRHTGHQHGADRLRAQCDGQVVEVRADLECDDAARHDARRDDDDEQPARVEGRGTDRRHEALCQRADRVVVPSPARPERQPDPRRAEALQRGVRADRQRRTGAEEQEVGGRDVARVGAEDLTHEQQGDDRAHVLDRGRRGREHELAACVLGRSRDGDDAVEQDLRQHQEEQDPTLLARCGRRLRPVDAQRQQVHEHRREDRDDDRGPDEPRDREPDETAQELASTTYARARRARQRPTG